MSPRDARAQWIEAWEAIDRDAEARRDSPAALPALERAYSELAGEDRVRVDEVLIEWSLSDDSKKRFDALALIDVFLIRSALPALRALEREFDSSDAPSAPFDLAKVRRIIDGLSLDSER